MKKRDFLRNLSKALKPMRCDEREKSLAYYEELINDHIEMDLEEEAAVAKCGEINIIANDILSDAEMAGSLRPKRRTVNTVLLVAGSPLWLAIACTLVAAIISIYAAIWAVIITLFACLLAILVSGLVGILEFILQLIGTFPATAFMFLGAGLICIAIVILLYTPVMRLTKTLVKVTVAVCKSLWKKVFIRGGKINEK